MVDLFIKQSKCKSLLFILGDIYDSLFLLRTQKILHKLHTTIYKVIQMSESQGDFDDINIRTPTQTPNTHTLIIFLRKE